MKFILVRLVFLVILPFNLIAQKFDPTFGPILKGTGRIFSVAEAGDGNFLAVGIIDYNDNEPSGRVLKFDALGNFVEGFNKVFTDKPVRELKVLPDGKILIQGDFTNINDNPAENLARLNSDGSFDETFKADSPIPIGDFELQSDGKIIIQPLYKAKAKLYRLLPDGTRDNTFTTSWSLSMSTIFSMAIDGSDRILIANPTNIYRLSSDGVRDFSFSVSSDPENGQIHCVVGQADGKILVGGTFTSFLGVAKNGLARLNSNGTLDTEFTQSPDYTGTEVIRVLTSGSIVTSGYQNYIYKFSAAGDSREIISTLYPNVVHDIQETSTHQLLVGGNFTYMKGNAQASIALLNSDYSFNTNFRPHIFSAPQNGGRDIGITTGGQILLGGFDSNFMAIGNISQTLIQLNTDGTLDESFTPALESNSSIYSLEVQNNKKILVSGYLNFGNSIRSFARLNSDGSNDAEFNFGSGTNGTVQKIMFNGADIFLGGNFTSYNDVKSPAFIIINHNGEIKHTCNVFDEFSTIGDFDIQTDGKIIVVGALGLNGSLKGMVRLNKNGTLDNTFTPKEFDNFMAIKIDAEDRIYVGGALALSPQISPQILVRYLPDGTVDESFTNGQSFSLIGDGYKLVALIDILPSNQLVVGGNFDFYKDTRANGLVIFDKDGTNFSVVPGLSPSSVITRMKYHGSNIYVGGRLAFDDGRKVIGLGKVKLNKLEFMVPNVPKEFEFRASPDQDLTLQWKDNTDAEDGYEIERLNTTTQIFEPIEQTSSNYTAFVESDVTATVESNYRIRSFNENGKSAYTYVSKSITGLETNQPNLHTYPNPAFGNVHVETNSPILNVELLDALGQKINTSYQHDEDGILIDLSTVRPGFLLVRVETITGTQQTSIIKR